MGKRLGVLAIASSQLQEEPKGFQPFVILAAATRCY